MVGSEGLGGRIRGERAFGGRRRGSLHLRVVIVRIAYIFKISMQKNELRIKK